MNVNHMDLKNFIKICLKDNVLGNLGKLDPGSANLASLSNDNIDIVKESLSKNHSQLLEVEKNTRRQRER